MLLALHGFTEIDSGWQRLLAPVDADLRCPLLPGHGWRPCPPDTTLAACAAEFAAALPAAGGDVVGYSMGGRVAIQLALDHPRRVRRLVLVSCNPGIGDEAERSKRQGRDERLAQILEEDGIGPFVAWWESNPTLAPAKPASRAAEEALRSIRLNQEPCGLAASLRALGAGPAANNLWPRLGSIAMPTLLIAGAADGHYCRIMGEMAKLIPGSRMETVAECGHAVQREQPERLVALIKGFLVG